MPTVETGATPVQQDGSLEAAGQAILGLLSPKQGEDKEPKTRQPEQQPQQESQSTPAAEQAPTAQGEETPSESATEPPTSEESQQPPPEPRRLKVKLPEGEQELPEEEVVKGYLRTADYTRKTQALAEERRKFEQDELSPVRQERATYKELLGQLHDALSALQPQEPDWDAIRKTVSPEEFTAQWIQWDQHTKRLEKITAERQRVRQQEAKDAEAGFRAHLHQEATKLADAIPDFQDAEKAKVLRTDLRDYALSLGYPEEQVEAVTDHRLLVLLHKAMLHDRAVKNRPAVQQKIEAAMTPSAPGASVEPKKPDKLAQAKARLYETHSLEDGARAIAHLLE